MGKKYCQWLGIGLGPWRWALFCVLLRSHLVLNVFPFPLNICCAINRERTSAKKGEVEQIRFLAWPILSRLLCYVITTGAGEVRQRKKKVRKISGFRCKFVPLRL